MFLSLQYLSSRSEDKRLGKNLLIIFHDMVPLWRFRDLRKTNKNPNKQNLSFFLTRHAFKVAFGCNAWVTVDSFGINDTNGCSYLHTCAVNNIDETSGALTPTLT